MAMLNWQGWAATNFVGWGSVGAATPVATPQAVGGGKPSRVRRRHFVEVEGALYEVRDQRQAIEVLQRLHEEAKAKAAEAVKAKPKATAKAKAAPVEPPKIVMRQPERPEPFTQQLQAQVDATNAAIEKTYRAAAESYAAFVAHQRALDDEDEEIEHLFMIGVL